MATDTITYDQHNGFTWLHYGRKRFKLAIGLERTKGLAVFMGVPLVLRLLDREDLVRIEPPTRRGAGDDPAGEAVSLRVLSGDTKLKPEEAEQVVYTTEAPAPPPPRRRGRPKASLS